MAQSTPTDVRRSRLLLAGYWFAAGSTIHVIDHLRRGQDSVSESLFWLGNLGLVLQVVTVTLILTAHGRAPDVAVGAGAMLAGGFAAVHWLPRWSVLSDPIWDIPSAPWFSAFASLAEISGAIAITAAGLGLLTRHRVRAR